MHAPTRVGVLNELNWQAAVLNAIDLLFPERFRTLWRLWPDGPLLASLVSRTDQQCSPTPLDTRKILDHSATERRVRQRDRWWCQRC